MSAILSTSISWPEVPPEQQYYQYSVGYVAQRLSKIVLEEVSVSIQSETNESLFYLWMVPSGIIAPLSLALLISTLFRFAPSILVFLKSALLKLA